MRTPPARSFCRVRLPLAGIGAVLAVLAFLAPPPRAAGAGGASLIIDAQYNNTPYPYSAVDSFPFVGVGNFNRGELDVLGGSMTVTSSDNFAMEIGGGHPGSVVQTGGTVVVNGNLSVGGQNRSDLTSSINVSAGLFDASGAPNFTVGDGLCYVNVSGNGVIKAGRLQLGVGSLYPNATFNLDGGTFVAGSIARGDNSPTYAASAFNFNGGTLQAAGNNASFISGISTLQVRNGGAVIDTAGFSVTIPEAIAHSSGDNATDGGLTKKGDGTLLLAGDNGFTGPTTVNAGTLVLAGNNAYTGTTIAEGATLQIGAGAASGALGGGDIEDDGALVFNLAGNLTWSRVVTGAGSLVQNGPGTLTLTLAQQSYTGGTLINGGTLVLGDGTNPAVLSDNTPTLTAQVGVTMNGGAFQISSNAAVYGGAGLDDDFNAGSGATAVVINGNYCPVTNAGAIGGGKGGDSQDGQAGNAGAGLDFQGAYGTVVNSLGASITAGAGANGYNGAGNGATGVNFAAGGTVTNGGAISGSPGGMNSAGGHGVSGVGIRFANGLGILTNQTGGAISGGVTMADFDVNSVTLYNGSSISGGLNLGSHTSTVITLTGTGAQTYSAAVDATTFHGRLVKAGAGAWTLDQTMTYVGGTQVQAGTLTIADPNALGSGTVTVSNGATLNGAAGANIHGALTVASGGTVSLAGGTLTASGGVTNNGVLRLEKGAALAVSGGAFTNSGVLDVLTGSYSAASGFANTGVVYDSSLVKASSVNYQLAAHQFTVTISGYPGHTYRLEKSASLASGFSSAGVADQSVPSDTATNPPTGPIPLTFTDPNQSGTQGFYRITIDP